MLYIMQVNVVLYLILFLFTVYLNWKSTALSFTLE